MMQRHDMRPAHQNEVMAWGDKFNWFVLCPPSLTLLWFLDDVLLSLTVYLSLNEAHAFEALCKIQYHLNVLKFHAAVFLWKQTAVRWGNSRLAVLTDNLYRALVVDLSWCVRACTTRQIAKALCMCVCVCEGEIVCVCVPVISLSPGCHRLSTCCHAAIRGLLLYLLHHVTIAVMISACVCACVRVWYCITQAW